MIDKEEVRQAFEKCKNGFGIVGKIFKEEIEKDSPFDILLQLAEDFISEKIVYCIGEFPRQATKEELLEIICKTLYPDYQLEESIKKNFGALVEALAGKVPKPVNVDEIKNIIKSSWLNTSARADLCQKAKLGKLEKINNEQVTALAQDLVGSVGRVVVTKEEIEQVISEKMEKWHSIPDSTDKNFYVKPLIEYLADALMEKFGKGERNE